MKTIIHWHTFLILLGLSMLSVLAVFPYVLTLQGEILKQVQIPLVVILLVQFIQSGILFSVAIFFGLFLSKKIGFHLPLLEAYTKHKDYKKVLKEILVPSVLLGFIAAITIYITDHIFTLLGASLSTSQNLAPIWQKLLAALYGGITEEILLRLFVMTLLIWIGTKILRSNRPTSKVIVPAIFIASIIFGLGHLPITASLTTLTPLIVTRAVILNGIGGVVFGWLYWKRGLESAMIAHFSADILLLTVLPLIFS